MMMVVLYSQHECPLHKGNYRPETKSDKEILSHRSVMLKSFFFLQSFESKASESIDEEDILPERLWVLSHYQLLRRTCCEYTAVARESQKTKQVFLSNVLVIWLKKNLKLSATEALIKRMNNPEIQCSCTVLKTWSKSHFCQYCMAAVQMVIITLQQQASRQAGAFYINSLAAGHVIVVRVCFDSNILQLTELINNVVSVCRWGDLSTFSSADGNLMQHPLTRNKD